MKSRPYYSMRKCSHSPSRQGILNWRGLLTNELWSLGGYLLNLPDEITNKLISNEWVNKPTRRNSMGTPWTSWTWGWWAWELWASGFPSMRLTEKPARWIIDICRLSQDICSNKRSTFQLLEAAGWQPTTISVLQKCTGPANELLHLHRRIDNNYDDITTLHILHIQVVSNCLGLYLVHM